jgi:hypothetical protein
MQYAPGDGGFMLSSVIPQGEPADEIRYKVTIK